jgi:hypothetical protein
MKLKKYTFAVKGKQENHSILSSDKKDEYEMK